MLDYNGNRIINDGPTALDAQAWTNLAFSRSLQDIVDITPALNYAVKNFYRDTNLDASSINSLSSPLVGIDSVFSESQQPSKQPQKIGHGALWYENKTGEDGDKGIWLTGTAELAFAFRYNKNELNIDDGGYADLIFDDMNKLVWKEGSRTEGTSKKWTRSWLAGGFSTFSDNYTPVAEPDELGEGEKLPGIEVTAWRYFDISRFNPYAINLSINGLPPKNLIAVKIKDDSVLLNWNTNPLAVSYVIERSDMDKPIAYVSNLENEASINWQDDDKLSGKYTYTVTARDLAGNLDTEKSSSKVTVIIDDSDRVLTKNSKNDLNESRLRAGIL